MSTTSGHIGDDILALYLLGEATEPQRTMVENWLAESEDNQKHLDQLEWVWQESENTYPKQKVDSKASWEKLNTRIEEFENVETSKSTNWKVYISRIAAILFLSISMYQVFDYLNKPEQKIQIASFEVIQDTLSDGSTIALNVNSELSYPDEFDKDKRRVKLKGEAFFQIEKDKTRPFVIESGIGNIKVLGTSFNVVAREDEDMIVQVKTGLVQLFTIENKDTTSLFLKAGETGLINYKTHQLFKKDQEEPDALFWLNKQLNFNKTPLAQVFQILEKNYGIQFVVPENIIKNCKLTAQFENDDIETVIHVISTSFSFKIQKESINQIRVEGHESDCPETEI